MSIRRPAPRVADAQAPFANNENRSGLGLDDDPRSPFSSSGSSSGSNPPSAVRRPLHVRPSGASSSDSSSSWARWGAALLDDQGDFLLGHETRPLKPLQGREVPSGLKSMSALTEQALGGPPGRGSRAEFGLARDGEGDPGWARSP